MLPCLCCVSSVLWVCICICVTLYTLYPNGAPVVCIQCSSRLRGSDFTVDSREKSFYWTCAPTVRCVQCVNHCCNTVSAELGLNSPSSLPQSQPALPLPGTATLPHHFLSCERKRALRLLPDWCGYNQAPEVSEHLTAEFDRLVRRCGILKGRAQKMEEKWSPVRFLGLVRVLQIAWGLECFYLKKKKSYQSAFYIPSSLIKVLCIFDKIQDEPLNMT